MMWFGNTGKRVTTRPWRRDAFTLIELLVVIAIIAILAAMLMPGLARAKFASLNTRCKSNMRQMAIALTLYSDDQGCYPYSQDSRNQKLWYHQLYVYCANNTNVFDCPAYRGNRSGVVFWFGDSLGYAGGSYGYNGYGSLSTAYVWANPVTLGLGGAFLANPLALATPPVKTDAVLVPADMISMGDSMTMPFGEQTGYLISIADGMRPSPSRHNGGSNVSFCDGHVVSMLNSRLTETNAVARMRWNNDHLPHN